MAKKASGPAFNPIKEMVGGKRAANVVWTTKILEKAVKGLDEGKKLVANPFYEGNIHRLKADLVFEKTDAEIAEWLHCKDDILYFADNYCRLMTPEGIQNITLRDYQQRYLRHLEQHNMSIYLAARQVGKCNFFISKVLIRITSNFWNNISDKRKSLWNTDYFTDKVNVFYIPMFELFDVYSDSVRWNIEYCLYKYIYKQISNGKQLDNIGIINLISLLDKKDCKSSDKLVESYCIDGIEVMTDTGWSKLTHIHRTKQFTIHYIKTESGKDLYAADKHICYDQNKCEKFIKDFIIGDFIYTEDGPERIISTKVINHDVCMCDLTVADDNHRYYTNGVLSHNTTVSSIFLLHYLLFNIDKNSLILGNIRSTAVEILKKVKDIYDPLPWFLKPGVMKWNESEIVMDNGCRIIIGATTLNAGVSYTIHCALLDEFAKIAPNIQESFYTHVLPTITAGRARIMITSTQNGPELFCKLYTAAEAGENSYAPFKTDWWEVPEWDEEHKQWVKRDEAWRQMQIGNYGSVEAFEMQFGTSFTINSNTLVSSKFLSKCRPGWVKFVQSELLTGLRNSQYFEWDPDYADDSDGYNLLYKLKHDWFVITIDIAEGGGGDYTVFNLSKMKPSPKEGEVLYETVGHFRCNEKDMKECARTLYDFCREFLTYGYYTISEEYNTYGALFVSYIEKWVEEENPNNFSIESFTKYYNSDMTKSTIGIRLTHKDKTKYCLVFKSEFEQKHIENRSITFNNELSAFMDVKGNGTYKASFGHDDLVMAQLQLVAAIDSIQYKYLEEEFLSMNTFGEDKYTEAVAGPSLYDFNEPQGSFGYAPLRQGFGNMGSPVGGGTIYDGW